MFVRVPTLKDAIEDWEDFILLEESNQILFKISPILILLTI